MNSAPIKGNPEAQYNLLKFIPIVRHEKSGLWFLKHIFQDTKSF